MPRRKCPWGTYIEYFEDRAKAPLRAKSESDVEIGQKGAFCRGFGKERAVMISGFDKIVEERILKAQKKGEFDNLPGSGKPLNLANDCRVAEELRLAYKILKNADFVPPEIELKKEIKQTEELLAGMQETAEKYRILKKLNFLIMKLNTFRNTAVSLEMPQQYTQKLVGRLES